LSSQNATCEFRAMNEGWAGLCDAFALTAPATGTLTTRVRWSADAALAVFLKTAAGGQLDLKCCNSPMDLLAPVEKSVSYRLEIAYVGRPRGYPQVPPLTFALETSLQTTGLPSGRLQAFVFGDEARTQRLSRAQVKVLDGPSAGAIARFDGESGLYETENLAAGYVNVEVSADGFEPLRERVPVGANVARELVLTRRDPLVGAVHKLTGAVMVAGSSNSRYVDVKIEILDGPLAGVFTFTDEFFGEYGFRGVPPGPISVRASRKGLPPQTLTATVSGDTTLNFVLQTR
jgi:hypothetical protein